MDNDSSSDREGSPDWLRTFKTPLKDLKTLSSSSPSTSSHGTSSKQKSWTRVQRTKTLDPYLDDDLIEEIDSAQPPNKTPMARMSKVVDLDSDSEEGKVFPARAKSSKGAKLIVPEREETEEAPRKPTGNRKEETELQDLQVEGLAKVKGLALPEEDTTEGQERRTKRVAVTLPLIFGEKIHRSKVLLECEGDALDVSGDVGAVGRLSVSANHNDDFLLDLKGIIYKGTIVPSNTFFVVNIGQAEAKVEAIMNDFVQLQPSANIFETETMVEGTLEGYGFDSDEDRDHLPAASAMANTVKLGKLGDEPRDEKKQVKQKARPSKPSKGLKGPTKKVGKAKQTKATGKSGGTRRKSAKKSTTPKRTGK